ncbi:iron ABC transporter substrate-binding protein [Nitrincola tibetensis]|uniref:Iron ABC transporter substrate-binding protein n=1 Tax=Nitrincola tibetensis TaxID=2219697 RepID=A0A364NRA5_9GAMM|nr:ABC transporter substrate-binding protein [Nitrincola tibetensis]RAU19415.1 iron ABC transporter substrate-binding protein [Nitrincola tibetensis]
MKRLISALSITFLLHSGTSFAEIVINDIQGRSVTLNAHPEKVALGFYYEDYLAVAGTEGFNKLVSLSKAPWESWRPGQWNAYTDAFPPLATLPDFGNAEDGTLSTEALIATSPDVLILASWQFDSIGTGIQQIEAAGIPIVTLDYNAQTLEKHIASTRILGQLLNREDRAEALVSLYEDKHQDTLQRVKTAHTNGAISKKIYVELAQNGPDAQGNSYSKGMWGGVIDLLQGQNIAAGQIENWGPLSPEYIIASQPDVILLAGSEWLNRPSSVQLGFGADETLTHQRMEAYLSRVGWSSLPAVQNREVYGVYHGGNRTLSDFVYMRAIGQALYPDFFTDVNPAQELQDFYAEWMPIPAMGLFVTRIH